jgi:hypothetical protein
MSFPSESEQLKVKRQLNFTPIKEEWNEYKLEDGQILKVKLILTEVYELEEVDPATGKKNYLIKSTNVIATELPKRES